MADHDKAVPTGIVVSAYYRVHPDDRQVFIDAVKPEMSAAQQIPGCVYYAFAQDLIDQNTFHLTEGWVDRAAYEAHENAETFLSALSTVVEHVRILDRQGVRYDVTEVHLDDPRGRVG
jgi:quinol monooxygenase YgiN